MFRALLPTAARWRPLEGEGLEHLNLGPTGRTIRAESVVIGDRGGVPTACAIASTATAPGMSFIS